jgi:hypothetical protein
LALVVAPAEVVAAVAEVAAPEGVPLAGAPWSLASPSSQAPLVLALLQQAPLAWAL